MNLGRHIVAQLAFAAAACGASEGSGGSASYAGSGSAGGGVSGSANGGASGSANDGTGGSVVHPPCQQGILISAPAPVDAGVRETRSGQNGEFTDTCENGDLVQYECETTTIMGPPSDPAIWTSGSGQVVNTIVDCGGRCVDGTCPDVCPVQGDQLRYLSVNADGSATLESLSNGWTYGCALNRGEEGYDCTTTPMPGDIVALIATASCSTNTLVISIGAGSQATCTYWRCTATAP